MPGARRPRSPPTASGRATTTTCSTASTTTRPGSRRSSSSRASTRSQEFKLQTSTYSAEFGRSLGGVVNLQLKSGTNEYHGSVFEFLRNDPSTPTTCSTTGPAAHKPDLSQHQFGATFGGPIIKDKTFFFADYQGLRITSGQTYLSTVPSMKMRQGDFSEVNRVIYDPLTGQPFPGNVIPESRWDPASANIMQQLYPEPNTAGTVGRHRAADQQLPDQPRPSSGRTTSSTSRSTTG